MRKLLVILIALCLPLACGKKSAPKPIQQDPPAQSDQGR